MKVAIILGLCLIVILQVESGNLRAKWKSFMRQHRRKFKDQSVEIDRYHFYQRNRKKYDSHNVRFRERKVSFRVGENRFTDMNETRFRKFMSGFRPKKNRRRMRPGRKQKTDTSSFLHGSQRIPESMDWRVRKVITPPKDQGQCASCWSFAATGSLEAHLAIRRGNLTALSQQYLIDCTNGFGNEGCKGGTHENVFEFLMDQGGIPESKYPYTGAEGKCPKLNLRPSIEDYLQIPCGDENALKRAVALKGPVATAVDTSSWYWPHYASGIFDDDSCSNKSEDLDHSVLIVGYGKEDGKDYWIVRNSWGDDWGEGGYIRMIRNKNNQCGIATMASYPIID